MGIRLSDLKDFPHTYEAAAYAFQVVKGHKLACREEILACQRFIDDLNNDDSRWIYDVEKAEKAVEFIQKLPHTKGRWASKRELLVLQPWQKFIICNIFGWVDEKGLRRFRKVYAKIPRKNGKSILAAAIGHYMFVSDDEFGAEVYSGATTEKQALEVFKPAWLMARNTDDFREYYGLEISGTVKNPRAIYKVADGAQFMPLIGSPGDGSSPHCAIVDEYHEHKDDSFVETMQTGMGAREQPLILVITTAGNNLGGPCYMAEIEHRKVLNGVFDDDRLFIIMYGIDPGDDWTTEEALRKANPNADVSVSMEFLLDEQAQAIRSPAKQSSFKRKHLNMWVGAAVAWINTEQWNKCARPEFTVEDALAKKGVRSLMSVDLASKLDICAKVRVFHWKEKSGSDDKDYYAVFPEFYLPEDTIRDKTNDHYEKWHDMELINMMDGAENDFNDLQTIIEDDFSKVHTDEFVYDPWRAVQLAKGIEKKGMPIVEWRGTPERNSPAMREVEAAIASERLFHPAHPVLDWMASNIVAKEGVTRETLMPMKETERGKIDGIVAIIQGVGRAVFADQIVEPGIDIL